MQADKLSVKLVQLKQMRISIHQHRTTPVSRFGAVTYIAIGSTCESQ